MTAPHRSDASLLRCPLSEADVNLLLIQARSAPRMVKQEQQCFVERCRVPHDRFRIINMVRGDMPAASDLDDIDAVIIGGAGKYSAAQDYDWTARLLEFVRYVVTEGVPLFGSCWGHQVIARALGGTVVYDADKSELGCLEVELTEAGENDVLFHRFPKRFYANMGHHDRVTELPPNAVELARNNQPYQAFRLKNLPVYGTQFHSELDAERERERILVYQKYYREALPDEETVQRVINNLADTTAVDHLLYDFLTTFVARENPLDEAVRISPPSAADSVRDVPTAADPSTRRIPDA